MRFVALPLCLALACAHEQKQVASLLKCPEEEVADVTKYPPETPISTGEVAGEAVLLGVGLVLAVIVGRATNTNLVSGASLGTGSPPPAPPGWPRVWAGCNQVALCEESGQCRAAWWLEPKHLPELMERSKRQNFLELAGIGDCPDTPPEVRATSAVTWDLIVCRQTIKCWSVIGPQMFTCGWTSHAPPNAAPRG